jgi:hypothetical protein
VVTDAAIRDMEDMSSLVYSFAGITVLDEANVPLPIAAQGGGIRADTRDRASLFPISVSLNPRHCRTDAATGINPHKFPASTNTTIYTPVPLALGRLHPDITEKMLANLDKNAILTAYENSGTDFQPMKLGHRSRTPKTEAYPPLLAGRCQGKNLLRSHGTIHTRVRGKDGGHPVAATKDQGDQPKSLGPSHEGDEVFIHPGARRPIYDLPGMIIIPRSSRLKFCDCSYNSMHKLPRFVEHKGLDLFREGRQSLLLLLKKQLVPRLHR